jgi:adenosylhomocysteine nucleosidase
VQNGVVATGRDASRRPLAVVTAMAIEAEALYGLLDAVVSERVGPFSLHEGLLGEDPVLLAVTGVGKAAAASAAQLLVERHRPQALLSVGIAGGLGSTVQIGDVVVVHGSAHHDLDARPLAPTRGLLPGRASPVFDADPALASQLLAAAEAVVAARGLATTRVVTGIVATGDQVVANREARERVFNVTPGALAVDMETAAIAQVASGLEVPWSGLRVVSDTAEEHLGIDGLVDFTRSLAAPLVADVVARFVRERAASLA